jgi:hypothetical protein
MEKHEQVVCIGKMKGAGKIKLAARHNLRELAGGKGGYNGIDSQRTTLNYILCGAGTAADVASEAQSLMDDAGIKSLRKDAVLGLEIIISLPSESKIDLKPFFRDSLAWVKGYFQVPVVSAVAHCDQNNPHCHIIIVPLVNGHMNGSELMGYKSDLHAMHEDFNRKVGKRYGLTHQAQGNCHTRDTNPIGFEAQSTSQQETTPIGFANNLANEDDQSLSSVGLQSQGIDKPKIERHKLRKEICEKSQQNVQPAIQRKQLLKKLPSEIPRQSPQTDMPMVQSHKLLNKTPTQKRLKRKPTTQIPQSWAEVFGKSVKGA